MELPSGARVLFAPVDNQVDLRGYDSKRRINWKADDLGAELERVYPPITEAELILEVERHFEGFLKRRDEFFKQKQDDRDERSKALKPSEFEKSAMMQVITILEPNIERREGILSDLNYAARDPAAFLSGQSRIDAMSKSMCDAYSWRTEFFEGQLYQHRRIGSCLLYKSDAADE